MNRASERMDTARVISDFAASLTYEQISEEAIKTARMFIADYYAACHAGIKVNTQFNSTVLKIVENMGSKEEASVFLLNHKLSVENAAFMNAVYAHGADMDDGNRKAMGHVAAHVMSAVFALAESLGNRKWRDVLTAVIVGYEVYNRIGAMAQPGLVQRGYHSTGTVGVIACGAASAKLMELGEEGVYNAIAISAIQASGLLIVAESGQACKPLNPANAAKTGIISAKLAAGGIRGPIYPFESKKGWFHAMTDEIHYEMLDDLGKVFTICESYLKPYPSCRHTHCGIEAAISIRNEMKIREILIQNIQKLNLFIYSNAIQIAGQIRIPVTPDEAKFSIHYSLAVAIVSGNFILEDLKKELTDEERAIVNKIELIPDDTMEDIASGIRGARLDVVLNDGEVLTKTVLLPKGDAANPFTWEDMQQKMGICMKGFNTSASDIIRKIQLLNMEDRYGSIMELIL
ncbi:MmgE/PrpD family protein [Hungatella hathewayi]